MADSQITATILNQISEVSASDWDALLPKKDGTPLSPFSQHDFLNMLEESGCVSVHTGWLPRHILLHENDKLVAAMPLYLKNHSQGEYVFDYAWADAIEQAGGQYYPKLQCSVPFTPASAPKLLTQANDAETYRQALLSVSTQIAGQMGASSVHATFLGADEIETTQKVGWLLRHDTQFHWENQNYASFDDFLNAFSSRKRKNLRKERQAVRDEGVEIVWKTGDEITESDWDHFFVFYEDTGARKWGQPYLNREFFSLISARMNRQIVLMFAMQEGQPIAGTLNFLGADTLFGRYWGCTAYVPYLHFELCYYQAIDYAIAHGLQKVEAGAQGDHKLARGYAPQITTSAHWIANASLRQAIADHLEYERKAVLAGKQTLARHTPFKSDEQS